MSNIVLSISRPCACVEEKSIARNAMAYGTYPTIHSYEYFRYVLNIQNMRCTNCFISLARTMGFNVVVLFINIESVCMVSPLHTGIRRFVTTVIKISLTAHKTTKEDVAWLRHIRNILYFVRSQCMVNLCGFLRAWPSGSRIASRYRSREGGLRLSLRFTMTLTSISYAKCQKARLINCNDFPKFLIGNTVLKWRKSMGCRINVVCGAHTWSGPTNFAIDTVWFCVHQSTQSTQRDNHFKSKGPATLAGIYLLRRCAGAALNKRVCVFVFRSV